MSEGDFDFRPPLEKRERKQFEPPPWEREAFEQLQADRKPAPEQEAVRRDSAPEGAAEPAQAPQAGSDDEGPGGSAAAPRRDSAASTEGPVDDAHMLEMLAGLSAEDPPATQGVVKVAAAAAIVLFAMGGMLLIWAVASMFAARQAGSFALLAGFTLAVFGAGFIGAGWWLMHKALKRRGVL